MKEKNTNNDFELPEVLKQQKGKNAFETPDNYFMNLSTKLNNIPSAHPISPVQSFIKSVAFKYVAAAVISSAIITTAILLNKNKSEIKTENIEVVDNTNKENENNDFNINSDIDNSSEKSQKEINTDIIEKSNDKSYSPTNDEKLTENINSKLITDSKESKTQIDENIDNDEILTDNNTIVINNPPAQATISQQESTKKQITYNVKDSCYLDSCVLKPIIRHNNTKHYFKWSTGEMNPNITVYKSGKYWVKTSSERTFENFHIDTFNIKIVPSPTINLGKDRMICKFESMTLKSNTLNENYKYNWNINNSNKPSIVIKDLNEGVHDIVLSIKACNQEFRDQVLITVNNCSLTIPNVITPNNDGKNDYFIIDGIEYYSQATLIIMDRNGKKVYRNNNYKNNWNGDELPEGTYYYLLRVKSTDVIEKGGIITIIR